MVDLFIPTKKDKMGYRFGFMHFRMSGDEDSMLEKLNKIWFGSFIIRAWKPRFGRSKVPIGHGVAGDGGEDRVGKVFGAAREVVRFGKRRQFAEVLKGWKDRGGKQEEGVGEQRAETLVFHPTEEEGRWLKRAHIGLLKDHYSWEDHGEELQAECGGKLRLRDLGNNLILILG